MSYPWIILFDWDGTLIDSLPNKVRNAARLFQEVFGVAPQDVVQSYRRVSGIPRKQLFASICADNGIPPLDDVQYQQLSQRFTEMNLASLTGSDAADILDPETLATLRLLQAAGYPLYVSSSADPHEIRTGARLLGLEGFFTEIMGSLPGFGKGAQHVAHVLEVQSARREQLLFVGDEPTDVRLGNLAGVRTVARLGTCALDTLLKEKPAAIIRSLSELPDLLDQLSSERETTPFTDGDL
jgi:phosphoglycolate phosphatase-like HAD superfamily hydrolase